MTSESLGRPQDHMGGRPDASVTSVPSPVFLLYTAMPSWMTSRGWLLLRKHPALFFRVVGIRRDQ